MFSFRGLIAQFLAVLITGQSILAQTPTITPVPAELREGQAVAERSLELPPGTEVAIEKFRLLAPTPGERPGLTKGQILVAVGEISDLPVKSSFISEFGKAKTRMQQEAAIMNFASTELKNRFAKMNSGSDEVLSEPEDFRPIKDPKEALNIAGEKQPFKTFAHWGSSPFGEPTSEWRDLCSTYQDTMEVVVQRTSYPEEVKVEWIDMLDDACGNGLDNRYKKVVDVRDFPLWQWTTGRTAPATRDNTLPGVNVLYTGAPAEGLYLFLKRSGMVVIHGFNCRGNPIVPFISGTFQVKREVTRLPSCVRLNRLDKVAGAVRLNQPIRFSAEIDNPSNVVFRFQYQLTDPSGKVVTLGENTPQVSFVPLVDGSYRVVLVGEFEGKPIEASACALDFTVEAPPTKVETTECRSLDTTEMLGRISVKVRATPLKPGQRVEVRVDGKAVAESDLRKESDLQYSFNKETHTLPGTHRVTVVAFNEAGGVLWECNSERSRFVVVPPVSQTPKKGHGILLGLIVAAAAGGICAAVCKGGGGKAATGGKTGSKPGDAL